MAKRVAMVEVFGKGKRSVGAVMMDLFRTAIDPRKAQLRFRRGSQKGARFPWGAFPR